MEEGDSEGLADTLMWVVEQTLGQIPDLSHTASPSPLYRADSLAALEAQAVGQEAVERALEQGWYAIQIMAELQFSLGYLLLVDDTLSVSPWVIVRSHLEMASRAAWVLDERLSNPAERAERSIALQLDELQRSRGFVNDAAAFFGDSELAGRRGAQEDLLGRWTYLESLARELGFDVHPPGKQPRRIRTVGSTRVLTPGQMASQAFNQGMDYRFLSTMSHYRPMTVFSLQERRASLLEFSQKVLHWFAGPSWYFFTLCGFDLAVLGRLFDEAWKRAQMGDDVRFWSRAT